MEIQKPTRSNPKRPRNVSSCRPGLLLRVGSRQFFNQPGVLLFFRVPLLPVFIAQFLTDLDHGEHRHAT